MKVILPVIDDKENRNYLSGSFHNARYVCIYDTENGEMEWYSIDEICEHMGNLTLALKKMGIKAVICSQMSLMALGLFLESGFNVYRSASEKVSENIRLLNEQQLRRFEVYDAISFLSCSGGCNTCSSSCN